MAPPAIAFIRAPVSFRLCREQDIEGHGPTWQATSDKPWFEIATDENLSGRWVRLTWESSLIERPERPLVRIEQEVGALDHVLPAAIFGRQTWIGYIPPKTRRLLFSPRASSGLFGFNLVSIERLSLAGMLGLAFRRNVGRALLAILTTLIQMRTAQKINLSVAVRGRPISSYGKWRQDCLRPLDLSGIDAIAVAPGPHIRILVPGRYDGSGSQALTESLSRQPYENYSVRYLAEAARVDVAALIRAEPQLVSDLSDDDFVVGLGSETGVEPYALLAAAHAAMTAPQCPAFFGDDDEIAPGNSHRNPRFHGGFDPLLAEVGYYDATPFFHRLGSLRHGQIADGVPEPLSRVLFNNRPQLRKTLPFRPSSPLTVEVSDRRAEPQISIIIPTRNRFRLLSRCVESVLGSQWNNLEIILVDNGTTERSALDYMATLQRNGQAKIIRDDRPFNFSRLANEGAWLASGSLLVFLNNDIVANDPEWLKALVAHASSPKVGAVGIKLLFKSGSIQHVGAYAGLTGLVGHVDAGLEAANPGLFRRNTSVHRVGAVTGACLMIRRKLFWEVGGFDETGFPIEYNDIDLCYRLRGQGYENVVVADRSIVHLESRSRGKTPVKAYEIERDAFVQRWSQMIRNDPYFHPGLSLATHIPQLG